MLCANRIIFQARLYGRGDIKGQACKTNAEEEYPKKWKLTQRCSSDKEVFNSRQSLKKILLVKSTCLTMDAKAHATQNSLKVMENERGWWYRILRHTLCIIDRGNITQKMSNKGILRTGVTVTALLTDRNLHFHPDPGSCRQFHSPWNVLDRQHHMTHSIKISEGFLE